MSSSARAVCAFAAVSLFFAGVSGLVMAPHGAYVAAIVGAAVLALPALFAGRKPTPGDLPRIDEQLQRFRMAMLFCFIAATGVYAFIVSARRNAAAHDLHGLASLSVALWLVAFVLMFFVAYYRGQRRLALTE